MKNGFTLVELLAVIVILAIIALIATPIVLSIIEDTKESAQLRSAEMYLDGVENAVMKENMNNGGNFKPTECTITNDGNLDCPEKEGILEIEVDGEKPTNGSIIFTSGKIENVVLIYETGTIRFDENKKLVFGEYISLGNYEHQHLDGTIESHDTEDGICSKCGEVVLSSGLYSNNGSLIYTWQQLIDGEYIFVNDGVFEADTVESGNLTDTAPEILVGKLVIDKSVNTIGYSALRGCKNLNSVIIPNSVERVQMFAFQDCHGIKSLVFYGGLKYLDEWALSYANNLSSVILPNTLKSIGLEAFIAENLKEFEINYNGTKAEWYSIDLYKDEYNAWHTGILEITVHCTDGDIIIPATN